MIARYFMEFLIVDNWPVYHGVLERSSLKELWGVTSIHHLCTKFSMEHGIATVRGDQRGTTKYYLNSLRNAEPCDVNMVLFNIEVMDVLEKSLSLNKEKTSTSYVTTH